MPKRIYTAIATNAEAPVKANYGRIGSIPDQRDLGMEFVHGQLATGRKISVLTILDTFAFLGTRPAFQLPSRELQTLIGLDHPLFVSEAFLRKVDDLEEVAMRTAISDLSLISHMNGRDSTIQHDSTLHAIAARRVSCGMLSHRLWVGTTFGLALMVSACSPGSVPAADLDTCGLKPFFMEDFETESIAALELGSFRWTAHTPWNGDFGDAAFANPGPDGPFAVVDGVLRITATKGSDGKWRSGLIAAADHTGAGKGVRYGYFESRMKLPPGPGTWPAFWLGTLRPVGEKGPGIEIDVIEYYGLDPASLQSAVHVWSDDPKQMRHVAHKTFVPSGSLTEDYHTYGVRVASDMITFYLDRHAIWQMETPEQLTLPLYPLVNLALGSGFPIRDTPNPSVLLVDYVHVYALDQEAKPGSCAPEGK